MTLAPLSGSFRPGGPTTPRPVRGSGSGLPESYHLQFLTAEERSTAVLMGYFQDARLEIEDFIRNTGDLSVADATYYRQLLDETNRIASKLNSQGAKWTSSTIDEAYSAGWRQNSSIVVPQKALEALSRDTLSLISQTTDGIRQSVRQSIAQGILQGLPADQVRARILASGLSNIPHWPSAEYRAGVIARTETMKAYNAGHISAMTENGARFAEWIASPDEAVCAICGPRDGTIYRIGAGGVVRRTPAMQALIDKEPNAAKFAGEVDALKTRFPWVDIEAIDAVDMKGSRAAWDGSSRTLKLNPDSMTDEALARELANHEEQKVRNGHLPEPRTFRVDPTVEGLARHEFGHALHTSLGARDTVGKATDPLSDWARANATKLRKLSIYSKQGLKGFGSTGMHEGIYETVAESFTSAMGGNDVAGMLAKIADIADTQGKSSTQIDVTGSDPYPNARPLPRIPAHPRCRCTTRPVYRDSKGRVIGTPNEQDPKLPKDAMGGKDKPLVPPAAGDFLASLKSLDNLDDAARAYWRNVDIDGIRVEIPPSATLAAALREAGQPVTGRVRDGYEILSADLTKARFAALMEARYGIKLVGNDLDAFLASAGQKRQWLEALESYRTKLGLAWDADDVLRTFSVEADLGQHPLNPQWKTPAYYRAVEQKIALSTASAKTLLGKKEGYGAYDGHDGLGSLFQHELGHALERKLLITSALKEQWEQIHVSTKAGLSPALLDEQIQKAIREIVDSTEVLARMRSLIATIERTGDSDSMVPFYRQQIETHTAVRDAYERQLAVLKDMQGDGGDAFPSDYASNNAHEDFAETVWFYLNEPARLRALSPKRYAFMAQIVGIER